ncbi:hypothetical protein [Streptococcus suis]|uniref:hypothetical protein n=1 Tax=Streptococcus suis TaxID=1307 RepID=UPI00211902E7|nr:hypothetical protein [Streptococcus suis]MCQ8272876.1 hypothetical protein [Streptococcus suis]UUM50424.1 hypothetical protein NQZ97_05495 [Streptococcus suis]HEL1769671.1 hypothetical protein [Streptococcus suis]HEL1782334.1 hypothetical protein [Streptococcus suis]HEL1799171.1 hypothetical protein [Streptococcus suis]
MIISNVNELALAIVSSSSPELSIDDKIKLYEDSLEAIQVHNQPFIDAENKKRADNSKALAEALGRGESIF